MLRQFCTFTGVIVAAVEILLAPPASADPQPYPDISRYARVDVEDYQMPFNPTNKVWFSTPWGLNCGMWDDGSFGCSGDIPGAPPGTTQLAWFSGGSSPKLSTTDRPGFLSGAEQPVLPIGTAIQYHGTTCGTLEDTSLYCSRYWESKFLISPTHTRFGPP